MNGKKIIRIRAPSKINWSLRFKNRCMYCSKEIPSYEVMCDSCKRKMRRRF